MYMRVCYIDYLCSKMAVRISVSEWYIKLVHKILLKKIRFQWEFVHNFFQELSFVFVKYLTPHKS